MPDDPDKTMPIQRSDRHLEPALDSLVRALYRVPRPPHSREAAGPTLSDCNPGREHGRPAGERRGTASPPPLPSASTRSGGSSILDPSSNSMLTRSRPSTGKPTTQPFAPGRYWVGASLEMTI